jgi:predicted ATPase/DNA-binding SARP family transcriptional activator
MDTIPPGAHVTYSRQYRRCGKTNCARCAEGPGHGPYWYAIWRAAGRQHRRYLGTHPPLPDLADARDHARLAPHVEHPGAKEVIATRLQVRALGAFEVHFDGRAIPDEGWRSRKAGSLLKVLLAAPTFALPREQVEELLWPEAEAGPARRNLNNALYTLRKLLGTDAGSLVKLEGEVVRLSAPTEPNWFDALAFETSARSALAGRDALACRAALARYTGEYLPEDPYAEWSFGRRDALRDLYLALLLHLADLAGAQGEINEAEQCLRTALAQDKCHEEATARLMALLAASGRRAEGLRAYEDLAGALARELGVAPSHDLAALRAQLAAEEIAPTAATLPPAPVPPPRRTNLPAPLNSFIGRRREQDDIRALLAETRLLTLTGAGGCGKTRLALVVADTLVESYPDGLWLVRLAATTADPDNLLSAARAAASILGVREEAEQPLLETLIRFLAPRRLLLLLDNCEHLITPCAELAAGLLSACPGLRILTTSRESLSVPGETIYRVASLAVPPPDATPSALADYEAVALFLARARAAARIDGFTPTAMAVIAQICRRLDGIPLAIELAAARAATLPLQTLAARLDDCFSLLTGGPRTALPRQRTLRATLDWSFALLAESERVLLQRLAAFAGSWTLDAASTICDPAAFPATRQTNPSAAYDAVPDGVSSLVSKSLVWVEANERETRYRFLEPVRQYAAEALVAADELNPIKDRHLAWYVDLAMRTEPALWEGGPDQEPAMAAIEGEHDNCRAALRWSVEREHIESGLKLACALRRFWDVRGYRREGLEWIEALLRLDGGKQATAATRAKAIVGSAILSYALNNYRRATERAEQGYALCEELGNREGMADTLNVLGMIASDQKELDRAATHYANALALYRSLDKKRRIAAMFCNLGNVAFFRGEYRRAIEMYENARDLFLDIGEAVALAMTLSNMGAAYRELGDLAQATAMLEESARYARQAGAHSELAHALNNLGDVAFRSGDYTRSIDLMRRSAELFLQSGDSRNTLVSLVILAQALIAVEQEDHAGCLCVAIIGQCQALEISTTGSEWAALPRTTETAKAKLGEVRWAKARALGRAITLEKAVAIGAK